MENNIIKNLFYKTNKEELEHLSQNFNTTIDEIYNSEFNFNNADKTSGQRCFDYATIKELVLEYLKN